MVDWVLSEARFGAILLLLLLSYLVHRCVERLVDIAFGLDVLSVDEVWIGFVPEITFLGSFLARSFLSFVHHLRPVLVPSGLHRQWVDWVCFR